MKLVGLLLVMTACGEGNAVTKRYPGHRQQEEARIGKLEDQVAAQAMTITTLEGRLKALEHPPAPPP